MSAKRFRYSLRSLTAAVVVAAVLLAFGPAAVLVGTVCLGIFGAVRAARFPGRMRLFWLGFLLVGTPLCIAAWIPGPEEGYAPLFNYFVAFSVEKVGNAAFRWFPWYARSGGEVGTAVVMTIVIWICSSVPLLFALAGGMLAVWLFGRRSPNDTLNRSGRRVVGRSEICSLLLLVGFSMLYLSAASARLA